MNDISKDAPKWYHVRGYQKKLKIMNMSKFSITNGNKISVYDQ